MADAAQTVELYIRLRDKIAERDDAHKEAMKPMKEMLEALNTQLLGHLMDSGVDSIKIKDVGTVYKKKVVSASIGDWDTTRAWIVEGELWDALEARINKTFVADYVAKHQAPPPGVKYSVMTDVGIRRANGT